MSAVAEEAIKQLAELAALQLARLLAAVNLVAVVAAPGIR